MAAKDRKPYRIYAAYDSETTNYDDSGHVVAFPVLHQLGVMKCDDILMIDPDNVEDLVNITFYRHTLDLYSALDGIVSTDFDFVPVIICHNLAFDMYGLSQWLNRHNVRVLAKSARKPITFTIQDEDNNPLLVFWDSLVFAQQSLERMGDDCGYKKGVGEWDYNEIRAPETPLTPLEVDYAKRDIYTLFVWFAWWLRRNPDIRPDRLALNVVTKTGVVRERRKVRFDRLKGIGSKHDVGRYWLYRNRLELPKSDDELYTMFAATRGGFTFCASKNASIPFDLVGSNDVVAAYDATSMHPAQIVSHMYPVEFKETEKHVLDLAFNLITKISMSRLLDMWDRPIPVAFYACFEFHNLRPREGSLYKEYGIFPLASARYKSVDQLRECEDNGDLPAYNDDMHSKDYCDTAENAVCAFGKLISADKVRLYITELTAWEICNAYEWDSVKAVHGYITGRFARPSDMDVISVMQFYEAKDEYKRAREAYYRTGTIDNGEALKELGVAPAIVDSMEDGSISEGDVEATYLSLKADLNSIFGISCSNFAKRPTVLNDNGIEYIGEFGLVNAPKNPKVWYQFGQRIVNWSRVAQMCALSLISPHIKTVINGDTDSIKIVCDKGKLDKVDTSLSRLARAIDKGKARVCGRIRGVYPKLFNELEGIGHYELELTTQRFCASWNKAYCMHEVDKRDGKRHFSFTLAGVPTKRRKGKLSSFIGINGLADSLYEMGVSFGDICDIFLGYNVTYANDVIKLNARSFPDWGETVFLSVKDRNGDTYRVIEPSALAIYPMSKTINDTSGIDNAANLAYAIANRPSVNTNAKIICASGIIDIDYKDVFNSG